MKINLQTKVNWYNVIKGVAIGLVVLFLIFSAWLRFVAGLSLSDLVI